MSARSCYSRGLILSLAAYSLVACSDSSEPVAPGVARPSLDVSSAVTEIRECGTVIREPGTYRLGRDLEHCPGSGIMVAANDVTLQLDGHTISGSGVGDGINVGGNVFDGVSRVRVEGPGSVEGFAQGITTAHMEHSVIRGLILRFNGHGLAFNRNFPGDMLPSSDDSILHNTFSDNLHHGITINGGVSSVFRGNRSTRNGAGQFNGFGIYLYDARGIELRRNEVVDNFQEGIVTERGATGNLVVANVARRNAQWDLTDFNFFDCSANIWRENRYGTGFPRQGCPSPQR